MDPAFWLALAAAVLSAFSIVLHVIAPRTKTTVDDRLRDDVDELLAFVNPPPTPPAVVVVDKSKLTALLVLLVLGLAGSTQLSCAEVKPVAVRAETAVIDCVKADKVPIVALLAELAGDAVTAALAGGVDWSALASKAWTQGKETGGCAFVALVSGQPKSSARTLAGGPPDPADVALEQLRLQWGGVQWRTEAGLR